MRRKTKYKYEFDAIVFNNRWKTKFWHRDASWIIIGFGKRFFSPTDFEYYFNFFGLDVRFWFKREVKK